MQYSDYLGHESQLSYVEEHRLVGGKGRWYAPVGGE